MKKCIFICYSHVNSSLKERLVKALRVALGDDCELEVWDDKSIGTGELWLDKISQALDRAVIAILLITTEFLESTFIRNVEVPRLLERWQKEGIGIYPVILTYTPFKNISWLAKRNVYPPDQKPLFCGGKQKQDQRLTEFVETISRAVNDLVAAGSPLPEMAPALALKMPPSTAKLPPTNPDLFGREQELAALDKAWEQHEPKVNIVTLVAMGGVGKTSLVNVWLNRLSENGFRGAELVYGWSFYSQGAEEGKQASGDLFLGPALRWFGDPDPGKGSSYEKGERLARLVQGSRTLLILDGLEPLQHPPGESTGRLKDEGIASLLRELSHYNPGLCVITTRLPVDDLRHRQGTLVQSIPLEELSVDAGVELLRHLGVRGGRQELKLAVVEYGRHALALTLLGEFLKEVHSGDIRQRNLIPPLPTGIPAGSHARRVLASYKKWFDNKVEGEILHCIGLFDRPAEGGAIESLTAEPPIEGLSRMLPDLPQTEWKLAIGRLRKARLLLNEDAGNPGMLDCHPIIREFFGEDLRINHPLAWKEGHRRLYLYYSNLAKPEPLTIEEMTPLLAAISHGCKAGQHDEVFHAVYRKRVNRDKLFLRDKLGAVGSDLASLSQFFEIPWRRPEPSLPESDQAFILSESGLLLGLTGRFGEAEQPLRDGLNIYTRLRQWDQAVEVARHLSRYYLTQGDIGPAERMAREAVDLAKRKGRLWTLISSHSTLAEVLHQAGRLAEADDTFRMAEYAQRLVDPQHPLLSRLHGFRRFEVLSSLGRFQEVMSQAQESLGYPEQEEFLLGKALHRLSLGSACLLEAEARGEGFESAATHIERAVEELRRAQQARHVPSGLLVRAGLYRFLRRFDEARNDLEETREIAERGNMALHMTDYYLETGRLCLDQGRLQAAEENLNKASLQIERMGYGRRKPDCLLEHARLRLMQGRQSEAWIALQEAKKISERTGYHRQDSQARRLEESVSEPNDAPAPAPQAIKSGRVAKEPLLSELTSLRSKLTHGGSDSDLRLAAEIAERLQDITRETYDEICEKYAQARGQEPPQQTQKILNDLLRLAGERAGGPGHKRRRETVSILDVGTASGRDIRYLSRHPGVKVVGIDNADGFIRLLKGLERKGEIPKGSFLKMDMRDLSFFPDGSFDVVRHNASLVHMPVIGNGYTADLALTESHRVLRITGLLYIMVREGRGLRFLDTNEGFGELVYQFYTRELASHLLQRNGFEILNIDRCPSSRARELTWLSIVAEKRSVPEAGEMGTSHPSTFQG